MQHPALITARLRFLVRAALHRGSVRNPYIPSNHRNRAIFIHIPKTAGMSIERALFTESVAHSTLLHYKAYDPRRFAAYFKFAVLRDPVDRFLSAYFYLKKGGTTMVDREWSDTFLAKIESPSAFVWALRDLRYRRTVMEWRHFRPQVYFLKNERGQIEVDMLLRFEHLSEDFQLLCKRIHRHAELPRVNATPRPRGLVLTDVEEACVRRLYAEDDALRTQLLNRQPWVPAAAK